MREMIQIRAYAPEDHDTVVEMICEGMREYEGYQKNLKQLNQYLERCKQGDLATIDEFYFQRGGFFWVGTIKEGQEDREKVIASAAIANKGNGEGEIRRVSVDANYRRLGLGHKLIQTLEEWAVANGFKSLMLDTGAPMDKAQRLYESHGYTFESTIVHCQDPYIADYIYRKNLL